MTSWLHEQRLEAVLSILRERGAETVLDLGCGDGALLVGLAREPGIRRIVGVEQCIDALNTLRTRLDEAPAEARGKVELIHGSLLRPEGRLAGFDAAVLVETIEHIEPDRLSLLEHAVFGTIRPETVAITTPNGDFNRLLGVPPHRLRHRDHRFEWDRAKFRNWAEGIARRNGYRAFCQDLGGAHPIHGGASQMAVFQSRTSIRVPAAA
ncbi:MAG TPA: methyltransferase domain-containing protein [Afifellaceae bacterium]|nr:methyltransferase domain-containing protein [Afifellaceae bacterium]